MEMLSNFITIRPIKCLVRITNHQNKVLKKQDERPSMMVFFRARKKQKEVVANLLVVGSF